MTVFGVIAVGAACGGDAAARQASGPPPLDELRAGQMTDYWGPGMGGLSAGAWFRGLAVAEDGTVFVSVRDAAEDDDDLTDSLLRIPPGGTPRSIPRDDGSSGEPYLEAPLFTLADAPGGRLLLSGYFHIQAIDKKGTLTEVAYTRGPGGKPEFEPAVNLPTRVQHLAATAEGDIFAATTEEIILRTSEAATRVAGLGSPTYPRTPVISGAEGVPAVDVRFGSIGGMAYDRRTRHLYVAEGTRVRRIDPAGMISTVAGSEEAGFSGDGGPASAARFGVIEGLAVHSPTGDLLIADRGNHRVRRLRATDGTVDTVAGDGSPEFSADEREPTREPRKATASPVPTPRELGVGRNGLLYVHTEFPQRVVVVKLAGGPSR